MDALSTIISSPVTWLIIGILIGYTLSRKQDDRRVLPIIQTKAKTEDMEPDTELERCMHEPEEWEQIQRGRRPARP